jgi:hypothetical protein
MENKNILLQSDIQNYSILELASDYVTKDNEKSSLNELNIILIKIKNNSSEFKNLIKSLETFLISNNDILRKNSVKIISLVIERVGSLKLEEDEVKRIFDFGFSKMKDVVSAPFAVRLIYYSLINQFENNQILKNNISFKNDLIQNLLLNFKTEKFHVPSYYQETRFFSLKIFKFLIENFHQDDFFKNKLIDYINIVLDAIEGEKDPRNILIMFDLVKNINKSIPKEMCQIYAKNFFEILDIYYPIEFTPPKNSPDKITSEMLIDALNESFASNEYFFEFLIEVFRDKISSTQVDLKIQVLKTIKKVNEGFGLETMKNHYITIINLILHQILNNEDEYLHVEALITFKEMIKKFSEEICEKYKNFGSLENLKLFSNFEEYLNSTNPTIPLDESEKHILINFNKIFEKSEDLLFNSENIKNSYDAKDLIVILIEFGDLFYLNFKERSIKICIKLINTFLNTKNNQNRLMYLKNANSILFFTLKKCPKKEQEIIDKKSTNFMLNFYFYQQNLEKLNSYIESNRTQIKNIIQNLIFKYDTHISEEIETIVDITTCFIVKIDSNKISLFTTEEVSDLFNKIFNFWKECESSIENHLGICLNEIIQKYEKLNNLDFVIKYIEGQIKESYQNQSYYPSDLGRYLNLLQHYFSNKKLAKGIIEFSLNGFSSIFKMIINGGNKIFENLQGILTKFSDLLLNIFNKNSEIINQEAELFNKFLENILSINLLSGKSSQDSLIKCLCDIFKIIIQEIRMEYCDKITEFLISQENKSNSINQSEESLKSSSTVVINYGVLNLKIQKYILRKKILNLFNNKNSKGVSDDFSFTESEHKLIENLCQDYIFNLQNIDNLLDHSHLQPFEEQNLLLKIFQKISVNLGLLLFYINKIISHTLSTDHIGMISDKILLMNKNYLNNLEKFTHKENQSNVSNLNKLKFNKIFMFNSEILNYMILYNDTNFDSLINTLLEILSNLVNEDYFQIIENSKLFKFDKILFEKQGHDKASIYQILSILKDFHQKFIKENLNFPKYITTTLLLNVYSRFSEDELDENSDMILNLSIKALEWNNGINLKTSASLLKKMIKYIDRDFVRRRGYNLRAVIESIIKVRKYF